mmetsp:Transcript_55087/g.112632  ORF Transcript_55087/g.112632 Transcript_55087/m.112632 type:complete len:205 (-) Transcript_55087:376-990(-)|eukprot:CAMPEP_0181310508 /NCGR_PEP_ID=MMETSP1101-20121128/12622_1 /TAXON_ID=46948 /ORGANISM="Rhodomonas abbreviata, Strain Caron Lab Isolate" /LENGTH=204 /DNA_ID=CAMNT_0023417139 /DNA_START=259 /DNA_END=873 /DNA_ORIENTATION=+
MTTRIALVTFALVALSATVDAQLQCSKPDGSSETCGAGGKFCFSAWMQKNNTPAVQELSNASLAALSTLVVTGCYNDTYTAAQITCPLPSNPNTSSIVPSTVVAYNLLSVVGDVAYYYTCCNSSLCNGVPSATTTAPPTTTPPPEEKKEEEEKTFLDDNTVLEPPISNIEPLNLILLIVITFVGFLGGFLVDIAETGRLFFREA